MLCPIDGTALTVTDRQGIQIDFCPACRGVWLDRGELDKIIDAAYALPATAPSGDDPPAVGVWADSIQPPPASAPSIPQQPDIATPSIPPPPSFPQQGSQSSQSGPPVPNLGDLLAGLASVYPVRQGQIQLGQGKRGKKRPRGWLEEMFDIDLD